MSLSDIEDFGPEDELNDDVFSDDLTVDLSDVDAASGFEAVPTGWYLCAVTDWEMQETKEKKKLPAGTPGIRWEFTVQDGPHEKRKLWTNHWIAQTSLPYLKGFLVKLPNFTEEELSGPFNLREARDRAVGQLVMVKVIRRKYQDDYVNDVRGFKSVDEYDSSDSSSGNDELMPG